MVIGGDVGRRPAGEEIIHPDGKEHHTRRAGERRVQAQLDVGDAVTGDAAVGRRASQKLVPLPPVDEAVADEHDVGGRAPAELREMSGARSSVGVAPVPWDGDEPPQRQRRERRAQHQVGHERDGKYAAITQTAMVASPPW